MHFFMGIVRLARVLPSDNNAQDPRICLHVLPPYRSFMDIRNGLPDPSKWPSVGSNSGTRTQAALKLFRGYRGFVSFSGNNALMEVPTLGVQVRLGRAAHPLPPRLRQRMCAALLGRGLLMKRCFLRLRANAEARERDERALARAGRARVARLVMAWLLVVVHRKEGTWRGAAAHAHRRAASLRRAWQAWLEDLIFKEMHREMLLLLNDAPSYRVLETRTLLDWVHRRRRVEGAHCVVQSKLLAAVSDAYDHGRNSPLDSV